MTLRVSRDGALLAEEALAPRYGDLDPQGPRCPPHCRYAEAVLEIGEPAR
jgi:hypothetical protein